MGEKNTKPGKALERQVADAYRAIGARRVEHDVELAGHQIDVYVEMETADRSLHRIAVEAKDYSNPVGIHIVHQFGDVVDTLRRLGHVDEGVIVAAAGFSRQGRNAAQEHGLRLLEPADLEAMAGGPDLTQMRADYLASLRQRFEYLDLGGIAPRVQNRTVKLRMEDVFVSVQARPELESHAEWPDWMDEMPESAEEEEMDLRMLIHREQAGEAKLEEIPDLLRRSRVVVLGYPGSGKSTLLRHIAYAVACGMTEAVGEATLERLPIFMRIVQFSLAQVDNRALTLDTYIREICEPRWASLFQHVLDAGEALVVLDGLDEVIDAHQRKSIAEAIQRLVADYPDNAFLITSRIVGYQAARLTGDFAHYTIQPLPLDRIAEFVEKWYVAIECEAGETELSEEAREWAEELGRTFQERPGIRRLAENPLLLTIIALVNWRGRKLPNRRVELYAHAAETLIASWPYRRQGVELDTDRVMRLLSPVAYRIFATRSSGDIAEDDLLLILTDAICHVDGVDERTGRAYGVEFLGQISEHSGIFRERGYDERGRRVFGFLHPTFAEYFTARYLAGLWEGLGDDVEARRAFLRRYAHVPRWHEVLLLMAGDVGLRDNDRAERATRLLGDILTLGSEYEDSLHRDLLLAGECLADDLRVQSQAARYVIDELLEPAWKPGVGDAIRGILCTIHETAYSQSVLDTLLQSLAHEYWSVRVGAARGLGALGDVRAVEPLLARLEDKQGMVRAVAAEALGELGSERAVEPLLARLEDEDRRVRASAVDALGRIGDRRAVEPLLARLEDTENKVRECAARALGELGNARLLETLLARLEDRNGEAQRRRAVWMLGYIGNERAVEPLLGRLEDEDRRVRMNAANALGLLSDRRAVEPLLECLEDEDGRMRATAASALGLLSDRRAVEPLLERLEDEDGRVRMSAAWALGHLGDVRAVEPLLTQLEDCEGRVRANTAYALGRIGDVRAVEALLARLEDDDGRVRMNSASALGRIGDGRAAESLLERLEDEDERVRTSAAWALGAVSEMRAVETLLIRLESEAWLVRGKVYEALVTILNRNAPQPEAENLGCEPQAVPGPWDS